MAIIKEKTDWLLEVKSTYTYRIFTNGNDEMSVEVQLTEDFKSASLRNFALATMSVDDFKNRMDVKRINDLFLMLRKRMSEYGSYFELAKGYYGYTEN